MEDAEFRAGAIEIQWLERRLASLTSDAGTEDGARLAALAGALMADSESGMKADPASGAGDGHDVCVAARRPDRSDPVVSHTVSLSIDAIAAGGDGVARNEGLVVFVPRTAPGDLITASVAGKGHFARGSLRTILRPSSERVDPPCHHYTHERCGGCQIQHIGYVSQLSAKQRIITDAMMRIGKRAIEPPEVVPSPHEWRYRSKLTLALRHRPGGWIAGLHPYDDPGRVFALADCPITDRRVVTTWREILAAGNLLPDASSLRGSVRWTEDGPTFVLTGGTRWSDGARFFDAVPALAAVYWEAEGAPRRLIGDRRTRTAPAASFAQVNPVVASVMRDYVLAAVMSFDPTRVIDAYSGSGELAASLASAGSNGHSDRARRRRS